MLKRQLKEEITFLPLAAITPTYIHYLMSF